MQVPVSLMMTTVYPCDTGVITDAGEKIKLWFSISSHNIKKKKRGGGIFRIKALAITNLIS